MTTRTIANRDKWMEARLDLLAAEKDLTRRGDEVALLRQRLPWVRLDKAYTFDTEAGGKTLEDLFDGRSQLIIYHFMFGPHYKSGCPSCSAIADGFNGITKHLAHHDVMLWAVSRAPLAQLEVYRRRMGWSFPWASSFGSDFNFDFSASFTEDQQREGGFYNFRRDDPVMNVGRGALTNPISNENASMTGTDLSTYLREREGLSVFVLEDGVIHHTYSAYARGVDAIWSMYPWLDRAPKGRNETGPWLRRHDEYDHD